VSVDAAIARTHKHFGHLDVVVNNAGYALFGTIEEVSEEQVRAQFEAGLFGALWVTQAALPIMREQKSGHIIQVSSIAGVIALPAVGVYNATKWGIEGFTQSLAAEVQSFGIKVTIVEPVVYGTDWSGNSSVQANAIAAYDGIRAIRDSILHRPGQSGDPQATRPAILAIVDAENPPLRIFFGQGGLHIVRAEYEQRLKMWEEWDNVSQAAHGTPSNL
jgi:NAD(P)-dependent dehydrogenase (short-subunit alcohol dehydrogenase family)